MIFIDPSLKDAKREIDLVESYAEDCSDISLATIWASLDIFAFAHFWGWGMKALMIRYDQYSTFVKNYDLFFRNYGICWTISVTWEITEVMFQHILPNFKVQYFSVGQIVSV
jgi:phosphatidylserine synthase 1